MPSLESCKGRKRLALCCPIYERFVEALREVQTGMSVLYLGKGRKYDVKGRTIVKSPETPLRLTFFLASDEENCVS